MFINIIRTKIIGRHYNNLLANYYDIKKSWELIDEKYYLLIL